MRGEDTTLYNLNVLNQGTYPHAWGRPLAFVTRATCVRNIPTYVGKTAIGDVSLAKLWEHPHVRGEDSGAEQIKTKFVGKTARCALRLK